MNSMIQSVRIFGLDYKLVSMPVAVSEAIGALGEIDFEKLEIKICAGLPDQKETETILHEIFHGILEATGSEDIKDGEEALVNRLASGMNSVLRDNPELFKFLLSTWDAV